MTSKAISVIEALVLKAMAGKHSVLEAMGRYARGEGGPAILSHMYGISKYQFRGFLQRLYMRAGSPVHAMLYVSMFVDHALKIPSVFNDDGTVCRICKKVLIDVFPEDHIKKTHGDEVRRWVAFVINEYRKAKIPGVIGGGSQQV